MTVPNTEPTRKQRFNAALVLAGLTWERFCETEYDVTPSHLQKVLNGERTPSAELDQAIDAFISKHLSAAA